ncbi:protein-tyrosine kinase 2-beta-like [Cyanistes caeruleus]|nr:protein-tyrosine kinase 2-beta-like [Cyanistes caeruleus]
MVGEIPTFPAFPWILELIPGFSIGSRDQFWEQFPLFQLFLGSWDQWWEQSQHSRLFHWILGSILGAIPTFPSPPLDPWINSGSNSRIPGFSLGSLSQFPAPPLDFPPLSRLESSPTIPTGNPPGSEPGIHPYPPFPQDIGLSLRKLIGSVDEILPDLPPSSRTEIEGTQKLLNKDLANLIGKMRLAQQNSGTSLRSEFQRQMLTASHALAVDAKNLLDSVDQAKLRANPGSE